MKWYDKGLQFSCTRCNACCRHNPGYVFLSKVDLDRLVQHTKLTESEFRTRYTRLVDFGFTKRLSLTEKSNYDCIFWDQGCTVYEGRPLQCRAFPFWPTVMSGQDVWDETAANCPGMNQGKVHGPEVVNTWLQAREEEPFLED